MNLYSYKEEDKGSVLVKKIFDKEIGKEKIDRIYLKGPDHDQKDIIQSYIITAAKYDFSVYETRVLLRIVECFQYLLEGKKLDKNFVISKNLYGSVTITLPVSSLLLKKKDGNYTQIKKAFLSLLKKTIEFENGNIWEAISLIEKPKIIKYNRTVTFKLDPIIYNALLDFSKGYRKYELETAMTFNSVYAIRFYELFSGQTIPLTYKIETLREMFGLKNRYLAVHMFISRVIVSAKKELDLKSSYSFTYRLEYEDKRKQKGRKKVIGITFMPVRFFSKKDKFLSASDNTIRGDVVLSDILFPEEKKALISLGFRENELKAKYYNLLYDIYLAKKQGKIIITSAIINYSRRARNSKAYFIRALKKEVKSWKELLLKSVLSDESKKNIDFYKEKSSVYSFLKNHLRFSGEELNRAVLYVMDRGGGEYFNKIISSTNKDNEKIREKIINDIGSRLLSNTFSKSETNKLDISNVDGLSQVTVYKPVTKLSILRLKKNWRKIVLRNISFKERIGYYAMFFNKSYLLQKANKLGLKIYN
jgi:hypothetical protein